MDPLYHLLLMSLHGTADEREVMHRLEWHHARIHDPAWTHTRHPDGSVAFHRRT